MPADLPVAEAPAVSPPTQVPVDPSTRDAPSSPEPSVTPTAPPAAAPEGGSPPQTGVAPAESEPRLVEPDAAPSSVANPELAEETESLMRSSMHSAATGGGTGPNAGGNGEVDLGQPAERDVRTPSSRPSATRPVDATTTDTAPVGTRHETLGSHVGTAVAAAAIGLLVLGGALLLRRRRLGHGPEAEMAPHEIPPDELSCESEAEPDLFTAQLDAWLEGVLTPRGSCSFGLGSSGRRPTKVYRGRPSPVVRPATRLTVARESAARSAKGG